MGNLTSRTLAGGMMIVIGLFLVVLSFFTTYGLLIYGFGLLILGVFIFLNTKEDKIEKIKSGRKNK